LRGAANTSQKGGSGNDGVRGPVAWVVRDAAVCLPDDDPEPAAVDVARRTGGAGVVDCPDDARMRRGGQPVFVGRNLEPDPVDSPVVAAAAEERTVRTGD